MDCVMAGASGMQAVATGAQSIMLGESGIVVDAMYRDGVTCSLSGMIMGETVELLAREYRITREAADEYALETQRRAGVAIQNGRFVDEIAAVTVNGPSARSPQYRASPDSCPAPSRGTGCSPSAVDASTTR
jgi:acetyl-CoA acetyltransferase